MEDCFIHQAGIPLTNKENSSKRRAIWLYAFNKNSLNKYFENSGKTYLDEIEDNEIIRFLEIGIPVYCIDMIGDSWAVDEKRYKKLEKELDAEKEVLVLITDYFKDSIIKKILGDKVNVICLDQVEENN